MSVVASGNGVAVEVGAGPVGLAVGAAVGVAVGAVGVAVGATVGAAVGAAVGVAVGAPVGLAVGVLVGVGVGVEGPGQPANVNTDKVAAATKPVLITFLLTMVCVLSPSFSLINNLINSRELLSIW
jgi:hypothetical protein